MDLNRHTSAHPDTSQRANMPQIQYSEKYFDDVYEYRCARAP